jgi:hypothetical protein
MFFKKALAASLLTVPIFAMTGCGGDNTTQGSNTDAASFTLALTDGPVDSAKAVVIELTGVSIKPKAGEVIAVEYETSKSIDLLQLQEGVVTDLITAMELEAGEYEWVQLHINAVKDEVLDSYVEFEDGTTVELDLPAESKHGLRVARHFTLVEGEEETFTIDFDLRKSLIHRAQHVLLKPALHMVPNRHAGHVHGELDATLVAEMCADTSAELGAVYAFSGADATPADVNGSETDPVASALVKLAPNGEYRYRIAFLEAGEYTIAYTCDAASDNPEEVNELNFAVLEPVTIEARAEHEHPFPPHAPHEMWDESVCEAILGSDETPTEETATEETTTEEAESTSPFPPHLKKWCEKGDHEWHPRPGHSKPPVPPVDGEIPDDEEESEEEGAADTEETTEA